ncbi:cobalamin-dependent protein [Streptomyces sp. B1I3]|uniref:cobalamin-dependent protein n=1 Tax=Streptomyces sp. B1I3 TaxID=3042264 RepID=UPI0027812547|nr:cobalamin-dependent protein [Streptomyces sp. B1I3]MDQ0795638.1 methylaspartate mutase sigma subunit [Streptomyces sp. B1I3]
MQSRTVILGVAASDSHAVANQLIAHTLRARGFEVINLGTCTTVEEFATAHQAHPHAEAVLIGSLNGHAFEDLCDLPAFRARGLLRCPVIVGGNLSVGSHKHSADLDRLYALGVHRVLTDADDLPAVLDEAARRRAGEAPAPDTWAAASSPVAAGPAGAA